MGIGSLRRHYEEPAEVPVVAADVTPAEPAVDESNDLSKLTVAELEALASEHGIELPAKAKKAEVVTFLEELAQLTPAEPAVDVTSDSQG